MKKRKRIPTTCTLCKRHREAINQFPGGGRSSVTTRILPEVKTFLLLKANEESRTVADLVRSILNHYVTLNEAPTLE